MTNAIKKHLSELKNHKHNNEWLQEDYDNGDKFDYEILEKFDYCDDKVLKQNANYWIEKEDSFNYGYNRTPKVGYDPYAHTDYPDVGGRLKDK